MNLLYPHFFYLSWGNSMLNNFRMRTIDDQKENQASSWTCITGFGRIRRDHCFCKVRWCWARWLQFDGRSNEWTLLLSYAYGFPNCFLVVKVKHLNILATRGWVPTAPDQVAKTGPTGPQILGLFQLSGSPASKYLTAKHFPTERTEDEKYETNVTRFHIRAGVAPVRLHDLEELTLKMRKKCQAHEELQRCCVGNICLWLTGEEGKQFFCEIHLEYHLRISIWNVGLMINSIVVLE